MNRLRVLPLAVVALGLMIVCVATMSPPQPAFADCTNDPLVLAMREENCDARWEQGPCQCEPTCPCSDCPDHDAAAKRAHVFPPHRARFDAKVKAASCACATKTDPDDVAAELAALRERVAALEANDGVTIRDGVAWFQQKNGDAFGVGRYPAPGFDTVGERPILWSTPNERADKGPPASVFALKEDGFHWQDRKTGDVVFVKWRDIADVVHGHIGKK